MPPSPSANQYPSVSSPSPVWEPDTVAQPSASSPPQIMQSIPRSGDLRAPIVPSLACEAELIAILEQPLARGERAHDGFARKETEVRAVFASLSILDSGHLHRRLQHTGAGDRLVELFRRLVVERRDRLIVFLCNARRRQAIAGERKAR